MRARGRELANKLLGFDPARIARWLDHHVEDVLANVTFADGLHALARLAGRSDRPSTAAWAETEAAAVTRALLDRSWDPGAGLFRNLDGAGERPSRPRTVHGLLPLILPGLTPPVVDRLVETLTDPSAFWPPFPVPSVAVDEPTFIRGQRVDGTRCIWRGPASLNTNWLLVRGLRLHGRVALADELAARSRLLVARGGFNEFFDPIAGLPVGADRFGWATLVADLDEG